MFLIYTVCDQVFTGSAAKMDAEAVAGGTFELLGGGISGKYVEVTTWTINTTTFQ